MSKGGKKSGSDALSGKRQMVTRVKSTRGRTVSSVRWLQRQLNDPYVAQAKKDGYRSRAAYKMIEIDDKFGLLKPGMTVVDLGAAPGGWTQIAVARTKSQPEKPLVIAVDLLPISPISGAIFMQLDFMADHAEAAIREHIPQGVDVVLSDMAPNTTGHAATDHLRIMALIETAYPFARDILRPGGAWVAKVFQGGADKELLAAMKEDFEAVKHFKPKSSRADSSEMYVVATGYRGGRK